MSEKETVYAFGAGCDSGAVKIVRRLPSKSSWGKDRYYVYPLEKIEQVQVLGDGRRYRLIWSKAPIRDWRSGKDFHDYRPYEDEDVASDITQELIDHVKAEYNHMLRWYSTVIINLEKLPDGFKSYTQFTTERLA